MVYRGSACAPNHCSCNFFALHLKALVFAYNLLQVGFLVQEYLVNEVKFISNTRYEESVWVKIRGGRGREALYICCVYIPTDKCFCD